MYILKRNGTKVEFRKEKITKAIFGAAQECGQGDYAKAEALCERVVDFITTAYAHTKDAPTVEQVQDCVERVLIEEGLAKIAKSFILYRQRRAEIRKEKSQVLHKEEIDEVDKQFDVNALRVLASRYLKKNDQGDVIESPKELFTRVSVHATLPSLLYDKAIFKKNGVAKKGSIAKKTEAFDPEALVGKLAMGPYQLNRFHIEGLKRMFDRFEAMGQMKVTWKELLALFKKNYFASYADEVEGYYTLMVGRKFMPNTPAIANFGNYLGMGSACFVLGIEDSIENIMHVLKSAATIFKAGGGVGYNFSALRPEGDRVRSTGGVASGPISFMSMFDNMTDVIKQGGIRRGANMGIINSNHPDIIKFIKAKEGNKALKNFNISVLLTPDFWKCLEKKEPYPLLNPRNQEVVGYLDPEQLFDLIAYQAWESAEPGVLFWDRINEYNPFTKELGPIVTTNPCGEVLLYPNESCNLGSLNIWAFVERVNGGKAVVLWDELQKAIAVATKFLDNVVDINNYPLPEIEAMSLKTRKLGLGVMGIGDALYELELPYNNKAGLDFMEQLMEYINYYSKQTSIQLAKERGSFPLFDKSFFKDGKLPFSGALDKKAHHFDWKKMATEIKKYGIRNGYTTVVAPTGSISMIAGCSSGIEPVYSLVFEKSVTVGNFYYVDPVFERTMQREGLMDTDFIKDVAAHKGTVRTLSYVPEKTKKVFVTAQDITPHDHIKALASFQRWTDSSISKTNNFPGDATVDDIKEAYILAYTLGCKGVTVYRDGSIMGQVLNAGVSSDKKKPSEQKKKDTTSEGGSLISLKDEKVKQGLAVYKEASSGMATDTSLGLSPVTLTSIHSNNNDGIVETQAPAKCKLCSL